jgi:cellulose synthase/poly-beta-1,6-N-acetylglucosamine synthase-like glycosyltransferase
MAENTDLGGVIGVFIPTFRRPNLLLKTLESLRAQNTTSKFKIFVVDNDGEGMEGERTASEWATKLGLTDRLTTTIVSERGLSNCRNGGLSLAFLDKAISAVAMIDDDAEADRNWIAAIENAITTTDAVLFGGPTLYSFELDVPSWIASAEMFGIPFKEFGPVSRLRSTNNCVITRELYDHLGPNVFDPAFNYTCGEDVHLFSRCQRLGIKAVWIPDALVHEVVPARRCSESWVVERQRWSAANVARIDKMLNGGGSAAIGQITKVVRETLSGLLKSVSPNRITRFTGRLRLAGAIGRLDGLKERLILHDTESRVDSRQSTS